ncbi:Hypothetical predicted protein [Podarcis lilfordi]|uniref:Uncharacterized protein n=1 Tax=Podarcis lilfordi TaxID=74358 RepID=A0AA35KSB2_9SAUR|nr:Hypothetical predicted protein [Podarcis lilfordi]
MTTLPENLSLLAAFLPNLLHTHSGGLDYSSHQHGQVMLRLMGVVIQSTWRAAGGWGRLPQSLALLLPPRACKLVPKETAVSRFIYKQSQTRFPKVLGIQFGCLQTMAALGKYDCISLPLPTYVPFGVIEGPT